MKSIKDLRFVRALAPDYIPRYLIEQIKQRDYAVDDFYTYQKANCLHETKEGFLINPLNHLWVLVDSKNNVKGVLWFTVDPLTKNVLIQNYSVDKEYWNQDAVGKLKEHMDEILCKADLQKVLWSTTYPKHSIRHGFKRSSSILMEYDRNECNRSDRSTSSDQSLCGSCHKESNLSNEHIEKEISEDCHNVLST